MSDECCKRRAAELATTTIAVFSHNLINDVYCIAGLVELLSQSPTVHADPTMEAAVSTLSRRTEVTLESLRCGVLGLLPAELGTRPAA